MDKRSSLFVQSAIDEEHFFALIALANVINHLQTCLIS
jgi:hypothetical protein